MSGQTRNTRIRIAMVAAVALFVLSALSNFIDVDVTRYRRTDLLPGDLRRIINLSEIFAHGFGIAIILYLFWALIPSQRKFLPRLAACAILPGLAVQFVKLFIVRYRPAHFFPEFADDVSQTWVGFMPNGTLNTEYATQSFPSAHAATAIGLAVGLIWLLPRCHSLIVCLALLASFQRVVAGAHWVSDVFAGAAISIIVACFVFGDARTNRLFARFEKNGEDERPTRLASDQFEQAA